MEIQKQVCSLKLVGGCVLALLGLVFWCEFLLYYFVLGQCSWPASPAVETTKEKTLKAMFVADTHLLGPYRGHWFDKLRREWQMQRAFQAAVTIFSPEVVFFLGDLFDEGLWVYEEEFKDYVTRFRSLFNVRGDVQTYVVPGNHDMGFHYAIIPNLNQRFNKAFNTTSVKLVKIKGSTFVLINSMSLHQDGCFLCHSAEVRIRNLAFKLHCEKHQSGVNSKCVGKYKPKPNVVYSRPIILQHFPMYRESDMKCTGPDAASLEEKKKGFREGWECLSKESTDILLTYFEPRLIMSGHTHHGCLVHHKLTETEKVPEHSVPSFSWRNRHNPSFMLGIFTPTESHLSKCFMPEEKTIIVTYVVGFIAVLLSVILAVSSCKSFAVGLVKFNKHFEKKVKSK